MHATFSSSSSHYNFFFSKNATDVILSLLFAYLVTMLDSPKPVKKRATANKSLNHQHQHHSTGNLYDLEDHHSHLSGGGGGGETKGRYKNNKNDPKSYGATVVKAFSHHRNYTTSTWWRRQRKGRIMATLVFFIFLIYVTQNNHRHLHQ